MIFLNFYEIKNVLNKFLLKSIYQRKTNGKKYENLPWILHLFEFTFHY